MERSLGDWMKEDMTASALPAHMVVPDVRGPYRVPIAQFVADWNHSSDPAALIAAEPHYDGDDTVLLPSIAVVVHALCDRDGVKMPEWVWSHRSEKDVSLFGFPMDTPAGRWRRSVSPAVCGYHRVFFEPRLLNKGTPRQWTDNTDDDI